jgi:hypothetical protein
LNGLIEVPIKTSAHFAESIVAGTAISGGNAIKTLGSAFAARQNAQRERLQNVARNMEVVTNVEMIRANDGAARVPHETCLRKAPDPMNGYT